MFRDLVRSTVGRLRHAKRVLSGAPSSGPESAPELATNLAEANKRIRELESLAEQRRCQLVGTAYEANRHEWRFRAAAGELWGPPVFSTVPLQEIPGELMAGYSMDGRVDVVIEWGDGRQPTNYPLIYTDAEIDHCLARLRAGEVGNYGDTDLWLRQALEKYPIARQRVAVMGSLTPWYEAMCLLYGGAPVTIEYNRIMVRGDRLKAMTVAEYDKNPMVLDSAFSISSFEHDGLGKYGDPLDPDGDLKAMHKMKSAIKRGGLMYFTVPIARDRVCFNVHRIYGKIRLPLLLEGWEIVETFGFHEGMYDHDGGIQPIFVLRNL